jgi:hypothetical protein
MADKAVSETQAKRNILIGLSTALSALSRRMSAQRAAAVRITVLALRAEKIAEQSWLLIRSESQNLDRERALLVEEISAFVAEVTDVAKCADQQAPVGREVANAISAHSEDIAKLAQELDHLADAAAVRLHLKPLSETLAVLPDRMRANAATIKDVQGIAGLANGLAERSGRLAKGGIQAHREAAEMSRDLRRFAEEATAISLEMTEGSALAVKAIDDMVGRTVALSQGKPVLDQRATTTVKQASPSLPASTDWGTAQRRKK